MYVGRVACCPLVSNGEYTNDRDRQTYAEGGQRNKVELLRSTATSLTGLVHFNQIQ